MEFIHPKRIGTYLVVKYCGGGAFGQVYECIEKETGQIVAIKCVLKSKGVFVDREIETITNPALKHPNIVNHRQIFTEKDYSCIVMDYYPLGDLDSITQTYKQNNEDIPEDFVRFVGQEVVLGLLVLEENNLSHRDLKPPNLFLDMEGGLRIRLGDFGITKKLGERIHTATMVTGSIGFASPEVLGAGELCSASDIFSLGCVLYFLMVGEPPYTGANAWAYATALQKGIFRGIQTVKKGVYSKELTTTVEKMLSIDPHLRPTAVLLRGEASLCPSHRFMKAFFILWFILPSILLLYFLTNSRADDGN